MLILFPFILDITGKVCADESAGGYNVERVESEYKLAVPFEQADDVWRHLQTRYDPKSENFILKDAPGDFTVTFSQEVFIDTYFDTAAFPLLRQESGVRHRRRYIPGGADNEKNGRELVQIKMNRPGDNVLNRTELKFPVKYYARKKDYEDKHALLGLIQRSERSSFIQRMAEFGIEAKNLRPILNVKQHRQRVYIRRDGSDFATVTLDKVTASRWWAEKVFYEIEYELNEIGYTQGDEAERAFMESINARLKADIANHFPDIHQDQTPKYNKAFNILNNTFVSFPLAVRLGLPLEAAVPGGILLGLGGTAAVIFYRRRKKLRQQTPESDYPSSASWNRRPVTL